MKMLGFKLTVVWCETLMWYIILFSRRNRGKDIKGGIHHINMFEEIIPYFIFEFQTLFVIHGDIIIEEKH